MCALNVLFHALGFLGQPHPDKDITIQKAQQVGNYNYVLKC